MKRSIESASALIVVGAVMMAAGSASAQQVRWRASGSFTATHSTTIAMETFKSEVARLSKNTIQVDLFPGNTLGGGFEQVDQLRTGQIEMAWGGLSFYDKLLPELGAVNLPFAATSANQAICEVEGELGRYIEEKMAEKGVLLLGWGQIGARHVTNNKRPIKTMADLKGLKVRMMGNPLFVDTMNALGGNGVALGFDQVFSSMQTGVIDGAENNPPSYVFDNHYTVAKHYSLTEHLIVPEMLVFSKKTWDGLSKDDQALLTKFGREAQLEERELWAKYEKSALDRARAAGVEIIEVPDKKPFQDAVKPVWDKYAPKYAGMIKRIQDVT